MNVYPMLLYGNELWGLKQSKRIDKNHFYDRKDLFKFLSN